MTFVQMLRLLHLCSVYTHHDLLAVFFVADVFRESRFLPV